uniref:Secreted protein n=1 Tax=Steinernema glaseri TaxID=37863 RepID=A0A1I8AV40_9BILA
MGKRVISVVFLTFLVGDIGTTVSLGFHSFWEPVDGWTGGRAYGILRRPTASHCIIVGTTTSSNLLLYPTCEHSNPDSLKIFTGRGNLAKMVLLVVTRGFPRPWLVFGLEGFYPNMLVFIQKGSVETCPESIETGVIPGLQCRWPQG